MKVSYKQRVTWGEWKNKPGIPDYDEDSKEYYVFKDDGKKRFYVYLDKSDYQTEGTYTKDFYDNFKPNIDSGNYCLEHRADDCRQLIYASPRKDGTTTYFSGAGDDAVNGVGEGARLLFDMKSTDAEKTKEIEFNESVDIKDGFLMCVDAPIGAYIHIELFDQLNTVIGRYAKYYNLLGTMPIPLNTEDRGPLQQGIKMRITVGNSDSNKSNQEPPKDFKVVGNIEMYRTTTC